MTPFPRVPPVIQCYTLPPEEMISYFLSRWPEFKLSTVADIIAIFVIALIVNRFLRVMTKLIVKPPSSQTRAALAREQQTKTLASILYSTGSKAVWVVALLTSLDKVGINPLPALTLAGLASVAVGFGAQNVVRDILSGIQIVAEDQFAVGDTIQVGDTTGRVEHLTLRRTVVRDARGALVTIANGEIRAVGNLSRDWSQAFVDVSLAPEIPLEKILPALEAATAEMRADAAWSQALVDGPRILGIQAFDRTTLTLRLQVRTAPTRQDEVSRELRRRIQMEIQRRGIVPLSAERAEAASASSSST